MADIVPSIRYAPDDPRPVGFAEEVSPAHLGSTGDALAAVAAAVNSVRARLAAGTGHWNSPIVTDGRIALPEGDANDHGRSGVLNVYRLR